MKEKSLDLIDKRLIHLLSKNGRMPAKDLAQKLEVSAPTVQSRMKFLVQKGILRVAGLVDLFKTKGFLSAIIAIRVDDVSKLAAIIDDLIEFKQVSWAVAVTGQYDIFAEVIIGEDIQGMFDFYVEEISKLDGVSHSESFMVTNTRRKWTLLPAEVEDWFSA